MATSTKQVVSTVPLYDYVLATGDPIAVNPPGLAGRRVKVTLAYDKATALAPNPVVWLPGGAVYSALTDANGFWQVNVVPNNRISPANTYYIVEVEGFLNYKSQTTDVGVPAVGWQSSAFGILLDIPAALAPTTNTVGAITATGLITAQAGISISGGATIVTGGLTISAGGAAITGNSTVTGTLTVTAGFAVNAGGAAVTGNSAITGTLTVTGLITAQAGVTVSAGGAAITGNSTVTGTLTVSQALTVQGGGAAITGGLTVMTGGLTIPVGTAGIGIGIAPSTVYALIARGDHAIYNYVGFQDSNAAPFSSWDVGIAVGTGTDQWGVYNRTNAFLGMQIGAATGVVTLRNALRVPPSAGGALPTNLYATLPIKLDEQSGAGPTATITLTAPAGLYRTLFWTLVSRSDAAQLGAQVQFVLNGDVGANYSYSGKQVTGVATAFTDLSGVLQTSGRLGTVAGNTSVAGFLGSLQGWLFNADSTTQRKLWQSQSWALEAATEITGGLALEWDAGQWDNTTAAVTTLALTTTGNFINWRATLWGYS